MAPQFHPDRVVVVAENLEHGSLQSISVLPRSTLLPTCWQRKFLLVEERRSQKALPVIFAES
jgi:hypothetical protein